MRVRGSFCGKPGDKSVYEESRARQENCMMKTKQLSYALLLVGIVTTIGHSQDTASEYVAPSEAVPRGKAPRMQVQLLNAGEPTKQYAVIFYQGDEAFSGLLEFAQKYRVRSAHFTAIGAVNGATLGWFDPPGSARADWDERRHCAVSRKARGPCAHDGGGIRRNNAWRSCSRCVCISDSGSNGHCRSDSDAEAFGSGHGPDLD
jgi:hypothetical protein